MSDAEYLSDDAVSTTAIGDSGNAQRRIRTRRYEKAGATTAVLVDGGCVALFCSVGRRSHDEGVTLTGVFETAWPFLTGMVIGWLLCRGWRYPNAVVPTGVTAWLSTVVVGMVLRSATSQGIAVSFIVVTMLATGLLLLGWRAIRWAVDRCRGRQQRPCDTSSSSSFC